MGKGKIGYIDKLIEFKNSVSSEYNIKNMILFGSRAKKSHSKYSDFDIMVISNKFKGINKLDRPYELYLKWNINMPVDFLCYTPEEFEKLKKQVTIVREAVREGIEI